MNGHREYKITRSVKPHKIQVTSWRYRYKCPFCKTNIGDYSVNENSLVVKCVQCGNKVKLDWED